MAPKYVCKLCMNMPKKNAISKIDSLPKTFTILLEQMSGMKFSKTDLANMVICLKCQNFLRNMENSSTGSKSNKISDEGKKRVFRLMEKKRIPAAQAIEMVLAEQRARDLLINTGVKTVGEKGNLVTPPAPQPEPNALKIPRLSGAQRKKAGILMDAGMAPEAARQLIYAAKLANDALRKGNSNQTVNIQGLLDQGMPVQQNVQRAAGQRSNQPRGGAAQGGRATGGGNARGARATGAGTAQGGRSTGAGTAQGGRATAAQTGKSKDAPVQRVAPVKSVAPPQNAAPGPKDANQKVSDNNQKSAVKKTAVSSGILIAPSRRVRNTSGGGRAANAVGGRGSNSVGVRGSNSGGGRGSNSVGGRRPNSDQRGGAILTPRRNERPAPYSNNRQQNQSQQQQQNKNFNQQQHQQQSQQQQRQNNSYEVGIVPINYPDAMLDNLKLDALKEAITNEILKIPQGGPLIRFLGTTSQNGWLKIICADQLSCNWLATLVSRWERAGVRMVEGNAMPEPEILSFYLQGDFRSPDEILSIIEKQNNSLNANQWRVINRESDGNGQRITVCVDERCFHALQSRDFMVYLGLGVVELKPRRSITDNGSFNQSSSSQNISGNDNFLNFGGNNMRDNGAFGNNDNYKSNYNRQMDSGRDSGKNYRNQGMGQGYQRGGYQNQRAW